MKYKVGDKVKIREDLIIGKEYDDDTFFNDEMSQYKGKIAVITDIAIAENYYEIDLDNGEWAWIDEMFEDVVESENKDEKTVDIGYHLEYCGHRIIKNVYYCGYTHDQEHIYCTTVDGKNQYTLPVNSIEFIVPHED